MIFYDVFSLKCVVLLLCISVRVCVYDCQFNLIKCHGKVFTVRHWRMIAEESKKGGKRKNGQNKMKHNIHVKFIIIKSKSLKFWSVPFVKLTLLDDFLEFNHHHIISTWLVWYLRNNSKQCHVSAVIAYQTDKLVFDLYHSHFALRSVHLFVY